MSRVVVLAAAAGVLAAPGIVELVASIRPRRPARLQGVVVRMLGRVGRGLGGRAPRGLGERIEAAGIEVSVKDVMAVKGGAAVAGVAFGLVLLPLAPGRTALVWLLGTPVAAFVAPDLWLRRRARWRGRAMEAELADVLDLLRVAVAAGLSPGRALQEVGRRHPGLLAAELRRAAGRARLGVARATTYAELERRCPAAGVPALTAALRRADRHGAPLGPALHAAAAAARAREAHRSAEAAARAAPQIQLVVALLLVPAVLLLVAAALLPAVIPR